MSRYGFSPTALEITDIVLQHVAKNEIEAPMFCGGQPGRQWLTFFMKRNGLSFRKAEMICVARKSPTENPLVSMNSLRWLRS